MLRYFATQQRRWPSYSIATENKLREKRMTTHINNDPNAYNVNESADCLFPPFRSESTAWQILKFKWHIEYG